MTEPLPAHVHGLVSARIVSVPKASVGVLHGIQLILVSQESRAVVKL